MIAKRFNFCVGAAFLIGAAAAQAALPPQYQRQRELEAVIAAPGVKNGLPAGEMITQVRWVSRDVYEVRTDRCVMTVRIVDDAKAPAMPGPRRFLVRPNKARCK